ncbi:MAG TPA: peptidoglycan DD-metalloendopeptidase family protein [Anaerolineales bacterium]|nr:peptidoglycan DD-metalloendopeptidase family protein [Anaerolineales bacterium]HRQ93154.1 peptidoglycan DD-metalloendopeptidase family protein [Anaerolineales bacterium]
MFLAAALSTSAAVGVAYAQQQEEEDGLRYPVQSGDTLSSIALRFNTSVDEIVRASNLANPNNLNVGDILIIPGVDWVEGTLFFQNVPLGETYLSLKRRYLLSDESMALLNQLTSPDQLYYNFSAMFASDRGELTNSGRAAVGAGQSLWELAAISGDNPWALMAYNQLPGAWAVPGDVLFTPAQQSAGPGGLPSGVQSVEVEGIGFVQGRTLVVNVASEAGTQLGGEFFGFPLHFFNESETQQVALQGIPLYAESGVFNFTLAGTLPDGANFSLTQPVRISSGGYESENLTVNDPALLNPELSERESAEVYAMVAEATPDKRWAGYWGAPHPYINVINSSFGIHRSYNGGEYENYHYGVDFGGGVGIEIWAPAPGTVIFAGPMDVRGNMTVIDHGWGVYTGYFHQSQILVNVGDQVQTGQVIGLVGATGRISGAHLHWEVWAGGVAVEPMDWLNRVYP